MARKKATPEVPEEHEHPLIVKKQAKRLLGLFNLPEEHPGRSEAILRYQEALNRNGIEAPPTTIHEAIELINQVGEFNG